MTSNDGFSLQIWNINKHYVESCLCLSFILLGRLSWSTQRNDMWCIASLIQCIVQMYINFIYSNTDWQNIKMTHCHRFFRIRLFSSISVIIHISCFEIPHQCPWAAHFVDFFVHLHSSNDRETLKEVMTYERIIDCTLNEVESKRISTHTLIHKGEKFELCKTCSSKKEKQKVHQHRKKNWKTFFF